MATHRMVYDTVVKITNYILNSVSEEGTWGTSDYTDWGPIITALNVEHLLLCGMAVEDEWTVVNGSNTFHCSIKKCLKYLSNIIHEDGSFGVDFWDTCKLATIIIKQNLYDYFDYNKIHSYIINFVQNGGLQVQANDFSQSTEWSGPGTYAACAHYLLSSQERDLANSVLLEAIKLQQNDGSFVGKKTRTGDNVIHPIWHTSQMLRVILNSCYSNNSDMIQKITHWIESVQGPNGEYDDFGQFVTYYTAYAAIAFLSLPQWPQPYTDYTIDYLLRKSQNGKVDDFGGTIMAAQAFDTYLPDNDLATVYQTIQISRAKELLQENRYLKEKNTILTTQINEYDSKYKDADIVLSKKDAWKLGIWFGLITLILGLLVPVLINVSVDALKNKEEKSTASTTSYMYESNILMEGELIDEIKSQ